PVVQKKFLPLQNNGLLSIFGFAFVAIAYVNRRNVKYHLNLVFTTRHPSCYWQRLLAEWTHLYQVINWKPDSNWFRPKCRTWISGKKIPPVVITTNYKSFTLKNHSMFRHKKVILTTE